MSKKLDDLLKKRQQLNARIQKEKNKQSQQQRKEDTRRKILLGALMMDMMKKGELDEKKLLKRLDGFLIKNIDRKLFDLTLIDEDYKQSLISEKLDDSSTIEIILEEFLKKDETRIIKAIREITGSSLKEAKELINAVPNSFLKVELKRAEEIKNFLMKAGLKVSFKK